MRWVNKLQQIARNSLLSNSVLKGSSNIGGLKETRSSFLGLYQFHGGGFDFDGKPQPQMPKHDGTMLESRRFRHNSARNEPELDRDFLAWLWTVDKEMAKEIEGRKMAHIRSRNHRMENGSVGHAFKQPPLSQPTTGYLAPTTVEEAQVAPLLARSNLLITRHIEWANLVFGFEQENRYAIVDVCYPHSPVGFIREQSNVLLRQFLRLRRPFVANITDALGNELFRFADPSGGLQAQSMPRSMERRLVWYTNDGIFGGGFMICIWGISNLLWLKTLVSGTGHLH
ncbi:Altered inheritance rate of mitochondria protein 25 [Bienertia sinuspersici]